MVAEVFCLAASNFGGRLTWSRSLGWFGVLGFFSKSSFLQKTRKVMVTDIYSYWKIVKWRRNEASKIKFTCLHAPHSKSWRLPWTSTHWILYNSNLPQLSTTWNNLWSRICRFKLYNFGMSLARIFFVWVWEAKYSLLHIFGLIFIQ